MTTNNTFMLGVLPLGIFLFLMITWVEYNVPVTFVPSDKYKTAIKILFVLSSIMVVAPFIYAVENKAFSGCKIQSTTVNIIYVVSILTMGLIISICGSIIKDEISRDGNMPAWGVISIGILAMIWSIGSSLLTYVFKI